jgi:hypothetical protein
MGKEDLDQWLRRIAGPACGLVRAPALLITALPGDYVRIADQGHTLCQIRRRLDVTSLHRGVGGRLFRSWLRHRGLSEANGVLFLDTPAASTGAGVFRILCAARDLNQMLIAPFRLDNGESP